MYVFWYVWVLVFKYIGPELQYLPVRIYVSQFTFIRQANGEWRNISGSGNFICKDLHDVDSFGSCAFFSADKQAMPLLFPYKMQCTKGHNEIISPVEMENT